MAVCGNGDDGPRIYRTGAFRLCKCTIHAPFCIGTAVYRPSESHLAGGCDDFRAVKQSLRHMADTLNDIAVYTHTHDFRNQQDF